MPNIYYDQAFEFLEQEKIDSAFLYFNMGKDVFSQRKDNFGVGKCLINMAQILTNNGDYFGAQETSTQAIKYFEPNNKDHHHYLGTNYNNLGIATSNVKDHKNALKFYDLAIHFSDDPFDTRIYQNNKAKTYQEIKEYQLALNIYDDILRRTAKNQKEYARALTNLSFTKWLQNPKYNSEPELLKALAIREKGKDFLGQNSSYAHLSDYYAQKLPVLALSYARKMYSVAQQIKSTNDQLEALQKLINLSPSRDVRHYFAIYHNLDDSVQTVRNAAGNQFALIRYEAEKSKVNYLRLQKDNTAKRYQIVKQNVMLFGALFLLIGGSGTAVFWYKKRKQRMELESLNAIRESQLKTSKRVHDVVANGLYRVMSEMQNKEGLDKEDVLDKIDDLYEKSRDISYEKPELTDQDFDRRIAALLLSFSTEKTKVAIAGNTLDLWAKVNPAVKYEIEHILQELMVNMKKHSGATNVTVRLKQKHDKINIYYTDNGIGMPESTNFKNGLRNTGNRIEDICGEITFDTKLEKGLKIQISFPIS